LSVIVQRYASALADVAVERKSADQFRRELASFANAYEESADLRHFLQSPAIDRRDKHGVIEKLAPRIGMGDSVRNFVFILIDHRRTGLIEGLRIAFDEELKKREGIAQAAVISARELSDAEKRDLIGALERVTGKRIEAAYGLDPELVGGAVVRIGSTIYDGSVREQLNRLRAQLETE
jgi:F-type H+-transporting ATPase subunit delta